MDVDVEGHKVVGRGGQAAVEDGIGGRGGSNGLPNLPGGFDLLGLGPLDHGGIVDAGSEADAIVLRVDEAELPGRVGPVHLPSRSVAAA